MSMAPCMTIHFSPSWITVRQSEKVNNRKSRMVRKKRDEAKNMLWLL